MSKKRGNRRISRELALRALYQWQLTGDDLARLLVQAEEAEEYPEANAGFLETLLDGVLAEAATLDQALAAHLDRPADQLSPIEHAILLIGAYELSHSLDVPYKVAINEAVNLAKAYGGTDGHKYVNGVLDKLARVVRRIEIEAAAKA
ncbi:transcription antitermination factor NusB [Parasulfuritortus cantonensis]|uniref:Transcription antitermination protein NusB n=1 Tax=Parasulfuritortus cantonensis TaxID=2528202 RepID=A0A4R1BS75_9PROT|nr:transcription antitermination factor NusB [Parasulfuritortus cantonensis]TCJ20227.1 transcription antitermination factor NusB [Parasulfuritortus cantonensis]